MQNVSSQRLSYNVGQSEHSIRTAVLNRIDIGLNFV